MFEHKYGRFFSFFSKLVRYFAVCVAPEVTGLHVTDVTGKAVRWSFVKSVTGQYTARAKKH